ncbi:hypothetical protein [Aeromicrobium sp.]|uniref:hypothetical protein n=1 Tax=Aeromicrobium sp. TaxID=1871063 RepID=UPI002FC8AA5A
MSDICNASNCDQPAGGGFICRDTLVELEQYLAETPWLVHELTNALSKQTRFATQGGGASKGAPATDARLEGVAVQPLIINPDASAALASLAHTLLSWQANLADTVGQPVRYPKPAQSTAWLMSNLEQIRTFVAAGDLYDEIRSAFNYGRNLIDRPTERRYLGDCGSEMEDVYCPEPLWGRDKEPTATCKTCGTIWEQPARLLAIREQAVTGLNDRIMTASEAAGVLVAYNLTGDADEIKMTDRIRKWAAQPKDPTKKPKLAKRTDLRMVGERARPGYKFGDILAILNQPRRTA